MIKINLPALTPNTPDKLSYGDCIRMTLSSVVSYFLIVQTGVGELQLFEVATGMDFNRYTDPAKVEWDKLTTANLPPKLEGSELKNATCEKVKFNLTIDILE